MRRYDMNEELMTRDDDGLRGQISPIVEYAEKLAIVKADDFRRVGEKLLFIKEIRKQIDDRFDKTIEKAYAAHKEAVALKRTFTAPLDRAETLIKPKMIAWQAEEQRKIDIARAEALRKQREATEKALAEAKKAEKAGKPEKAHAILENIPQTQVVVPEATQVKGINIREVWQSEVVDESKVPRPFMTPNTQKLDKYAQATQGTVPVDGVRFFKKSIMSARRR
jgi:hypothetical protein